jgi:hypothetical protein
MSFSRPDDTPAPLRVGVETTAAKRLRRWNAAPRRRTRDAPRLDRRTLAAVLATKYGGDAQNTTQVRVGAFKVPMGIGLARWERYRDEAAARFLRALDVQGWQVDSLTATPGPYPYRDVLTGLDDPDYREMHLVAVCGLRRAPEPVVVQVDAPAPHEED